MQHCFRVMLGVKGSVTDSVNRGLGNREGASALQMFLILVCNSFLACLF